MSKNAYDRERWQVEHTTALMRHRLLSCVVAEHALVLIDGLCAGAFKSSAMRNLVAIEQRWKELARLNGSCVESISNIFVQHLEEEAALPWQPSDFSSISSACVAEHNGKTVAHQRLAPISERHFECYARMLTQLAQQEPHSDDWYNIAAHVISAAVALGTHLDWLVTIKKK